MCEKWALLALAYANEEFLNSNILFTKSKGYSNSKKYNIYQTNVINLEQLVLISKVISRPIWIKFSRINLVACFWDNHI